MMMPVNYIRDAIDISNIAENIDAIVAKFFSSLSQQRRVNQRMVPAFLQRGR